MTPEFLDTLIDLIHNAAAAASKGWPESEIKIAKCDALEEKLHSLLPKLRTCRQQMAKVRRNNR